MAQQNPDLDVLLVEDNEGDVCLIERALRQVPVPNRVHVLDNGVRALSFLRREAEYSESPRPDIVILDLNLPRKGGLDVLDEVKRDPQLRRIPVIVLSSSRAERDVARAYDAQAAAYFVKPSSDYRALVELIMRFVGSCERPADGIAALARFDHESAERALERKQAEERFRTAVMSSPNGMVMVNTRGEIVLVNEETERMFGYERDELLGKSIEQLVPERFRSDHAQHRGGFLMRPQRREMGAGRALHARRKDGSEFPVEIGLNPITTDEGLFTLSSIVDITERMQAQEALLQRTKELLRSNAELEQFAYVASHDLQEPLRMVASYTRLLSEEYAERLDDEGKLFVHYARDGAERMQQLIHDLLAYSRVGSRARQARIVSMQTCVSGVLADLAMSIAETKTEVRAENLPDVVGDPVQISELLQNLISNAIKFRGERPPLIEINARRIEDGYEFSLRDNGIGIEQQYFDEVFQVFKRLHTTEEYPGTGIGLAICKRIVERAGGRIWVQSKPGAGCTFYFTFPVP